MKASEWRKGNKNGVWGQRSWDERIAQHFKAHELPNVAKEVIEGHEVYIGASDEKFHDEPEQYPSGYYKTAFAVSIPRENGKRDFAVRICEFDGNHNPEYTETDRLRGRVNSTVMAAAEEIHRGKEGGMYAK